VLPLHGGICSHVLSCSPLARAISRVRVLYGGVGTQGVGYSVCESIDGSRMSSRLGRCEHRITITTLILPTPLNWLVKTWVAPHLRQATVGGAGTESRSRRRLIHSALFVIVVPVDLRCCQLCCFRRLGGPLFFEAWFDWPDRIVDSVVVSCIVRCLPRSFSKLFVLNVCIVSLFVECVSQSTALA
jgi:hypothetical protein